MDNNEIVQLVQLICIILIMIISFLIGIAIGYKIAQLKEKDKVQSKFDAIQETKKFLLLHTANVSEEQIDDIIKYLINNNIDIKYKGIIDRGEVQDADSN